ncbi:MAG: hypothetical protein LBL79_06020 [Prevotella sp.]|jgi:hypothetical protein|nr:hypothetical protein [Prevotella sp.]
MKKDFTQEKCQEKKVVVPSKRTIDFLKQFARSYYVEDALPNKLKGLCLN